MSVLHSKIKQIPYMNSLGINRTLLFIICGQFNAKRYINL